MITIKEIAAQLGSSTTTVSNVIHGKTGEVSPETIGRVRSFLEEVEYVPNISARNLAQNRSKIIGVVLKAWERKYENIFRDPFVAEMIGGIDDIAEILQYVSTWNADGLILFCMLDDDALRVRKKYRKPIVCIDTYIDKQTEAAFGDFFGVPLERMYGLELKIAERLGFLFKKDGIWQMTPKGAFYFHHYENFYTLAYIDKMWGIMRREAFPERIEL